MTGFYIFLGRHGERLAYQCDCCKLNVVFAQGSQPRTWCCGRWVEYIEPRGFRNWLRGHSLPRVKPKAPALILRQRTQSEDQNTNTEI